MENISNSYTAQVDRDQRLRISNVVYRVIIVFLLFFITIVSVFIIGLIKKVSFIPEEVSSVIFETVLCAHCESEEELIEEESQLQNEGWTYYGYPNLGFSVELPSQSYFHPNYISNPTDRYVWSIYSYREDNTEFKPKTFFNFSNRIVISFFPIELPSNVGCGQGCLDESMIRIDFYENKEKFSIEQIKEEYIKYIIAMQKEMNETEKYDIELKTILGKEAFTYEYEVGMGEYDGYILLNDDYIVVVEKDIFSDGENLEIVNKVLNSIRFEDL